MITIVLRLNAIFIIYILSENTGPHCNYKTGTPPAPPVVYILLVAKILTIITNVLAAICYCSYLNC